MAKRRVLFEFGATPGDAQTGGTDAGWTESFYDPTDSDAAAAGTKAASLLHWRTALLTPGWRCTAIRLSNLDANNNPVRRGTLLKVPLADGTGRYGGAMALNNEQPWDSINLAIVTVGGSRRAFLMRGIASNVVGASGLYLEPPAFNNAALVYANALAGVLVGGAAPVTSPFALRTRVTPGLTMISGVFTASPAGISLVASPQRPLIRVPAGTVVAGTQVEITGVVDMLGINGQWKCVLTQSDPTSIMFVYAQMAPRRRNTVAGTYSSGGTARYWIYSLDAITGFTIGSGASRRTGRPPQQRRGRRSVRRS